MRRNITLKTLLLLSLFATGAAWAEWKKIDASDSKTFFLDLDTIQKEGNIRKVWGLNDNKQRDEHGAMSSRARTEYDCKNERFRITAMTKHSESMAGGKATIIPVNGNSEIWYDIPPDAFVYSFLKIVCAR